MTEYKEGKFSDKLLKELEKYLEPVSQQSFGINFMKNLVNKRNKMRNNEAQKYLETIKKFLNATSTSLLNCN